MRKFSPMSTLKARLTGCVDWGSDVMTSVAPTERAESPATPSETDQAAIAEHCRDIARERVAAIQQHLGANAHG